MRRVTIFGLVTVLVVGITMATVNAEPAAPQRRTDSSQPAIPERLQNARLRISAIEAPTCDVRDEVTVYVRCLNRYLKSLARGVNKALNTFDTFFQCTSYLPITQYGDPTTGTFGYVFDNNDGTGPFLTSALDITVNLETDFFLNHYVVRPTARCIEFAQ